MNNNINFYFATIIGLYQFHQLELKWRPKVAYMYGRDATWFTRCNSRKWNDNLTDTVH